MRYYFLQYRQWNRLNKCQMQSLRLNLPFIKRRLRGWATFLAKNMLLLFEPNRVPVFDLFSGSLWSCENISSSALDFYVDELWKPRFELKLLILPFKTFAIEIGEKNKEGFPDKHFTSESAIGNVWNWNINRRKRSRKIKVEQGRNNFFSLCVCVLVETKSLYFSNVIVHNLYYRNVFPDFRNS